MLQKLSNPISLEALHSSSYVKKSDLVAVATGTLGFQALCNGKKVLVFGNPFFKFFKEGAFPIKNEIDLIIFFKNFNSNKSFDRKQLFKFLNRCDEIFNYGFIDKDYMRFSSYSIDKNAEIVAKAVLKELF